MLFFAKRRHTTHDVNGILRCEKTKNDHVDRLVSLFPNENSRALNIGKMDLFLKMTSFF